ncbi:MAG: gamma-glutamylcyclotransferase [Bacteroidetes bacterium]|nr:gamma-glutamylcyclotransferase [Bacteroidota bacterium]
MENLFVYGTLLRDANHPMNRLIRQQGVFLGNATFKGKLFLVDYYPGSVPSSVDEDKVKGEVYALKNAKKVFDALDEFEEYRPVEEEKSEFIRRKIDVRLEDGVNVSAWVYLYNFPTKGLKEIPSGDFRTYLQGKNQKLPEALKG